MSDDYYIVGAIGEPTSSPFGEILEGIGYPLRKVVVSESVGSVPMSFIFGGYVGGTSYLKGSVISEDRFLSIANKDTDQFPVPQATSSLAWGVYPDSTAPIWSEDSVSTTRLLTGLRVSSPSTLKVSAARFWIPYIDPDVRYAILVEQEGELPFRVDILPSEIGWYQTTAVNSFLQEGLDADIYLVTQGQGAASTEFTGEWNYRNIGANPSPTLPPSQGQFSQYGTNAPDTAYWNVYDRDLVDRTSDIALLKAGDEVSFEWVADIPETTQWTLASTPIYYPHATDSTLDMFELELTPSVFPSDPNQKNWRDFTGKIYVDRPTSYVTDAGKFIAFPSLSGLFKNGEDALVVSDDSFGVDVLYEEYTVPSDWDILSYSG